METHQAIGERLEGYKTYLAAVGFALLAACKVAGGRWEDGIELMLVATATASLRHAIARKSVPPPAAHFPEDHDRGGTGTAPAIAPTITNYHL